MTRIFISYRRNDEAAAAARLYDILSHEFGHDGEVFFDREREKPGEPFPHRIRTALDECSVLVAVIGSRWTELMDQKRQAKQFDWARLEVETALGRTIPVIPLMLCDGFPRVTWPAKLARLPDLEQIKLDAGGRRSEFDKIIRELEQYAERKPAAPDREHLPTTVNGVLASRHWMKQYLEDPDEWTRLANAYVICRETQTRHDGNANLETARQALTGAARLAEAALVILGGHRSIRASPRLGEETFHITRGTSAWDSDPGPLRLLHPGITITAARIHCPELGRRQIAMATSVKGRAASQIGMRLESGTWTAGLEPLPNPASEEDDARAFLQECYQSGAAIAVFPELRASPGLLDVIQRFLLTQTVTAAKGIVLTAAGAIDEDGYGCCHVYGPSGVLLWEQLPIDRHDLLTIFAGPTGRIAAGLGASRRMDTLIRAAGLAALLTPGRERDAAEAISVAEYRSGFGAATLHANCGLAGGESFAALPGSPVRRSRGRLLL